MWKKVVFLFLLTALIEAGFVAAYHYQATGPLAGVIAAHTESLAANTIPSAADIDLYNDPWVKVAHFESVFGQVSFVIDILMSFLISLFLIFGGISTWIANKARSLSPNIHLARALYLILLTSVLTAINLPMSVSGFVIESLRGTSFPTTDSALFFFAQDLIVGILFTLATFLPLYWIIDRFKERWWIVGGTFMTAFSLFTGYVSPILIDPLYQQVTPLVEMNDGVAGSQVQWALADILAATEIPIERVYVANASASTYESNAMVTGFGSTKRVILDDTLLTYFTPQEIRTIVAHELGHYVLHHLWFDMALSTALTFATFLIVAWLMRWLLRTYGKRFGATRLSDIVLFPVLSTLLFVVPLFTAPLQSHVSRSYEHQADVFEVALAKDPQSSINGFKKMAYQSFVDVEPPALLQFWFGTHPTFKERIEYYESQTINYPPKL